MLTIVNKTGLTHDTRVLDENGNDITSILEPTRIDIRMDPNDVTVATMECRVKVDIVANNPNAIMSEYARNVKEREAGDERREDTLKSIEQHNKEARDAKNAAEKTGIACPSCGEELKWTCQQFLSIPPRRGVACSCGWAGSVD